MKKNIALFISLLFLLSFPNVFSQQNKPQHNGHPFPPSTKKPKTSQNQIPNINPNLNSNPDNLENQNNFSTPPNRKAEPYLNDTHNFLPYRGQRVPIEQQNTFVENVSVNNNSESIVFKFEFNGPINPLEISNAKIVINNVEVQNSATLKYNRLGTELFITIPEDSLQIQQQDYKIVFLSSNDDEILLVDCNENRKRTKQRISQPVDLQNMHRKILCPEF